MPKYSQGQALNWAALESLEPHLTRIGQARLATPGVVLVVTLMADGSPRLSPVEPWFFAGEFWLIMMWESRKVADLRRDSRILVHSIVSRRQGDEGDFKLWGHATEIGEGRIRSEVAGSVRAGLGWAPVEPYFHLFRVSVARVALVCYRDGDQYLASFPPHREIVRREATATSLAPATAVAWLKSWANASTASAMPDP